MQTMKQIITQACVAAATGATLLAFECGMAIMTDSNQQFGVCKDGVGTCSFIAYSTDCTYCGLTFNLQDACQQDGPYEIQTQLMVYGNCNQGVCSGGRPEGDPGQKTCYYCSDECNCGG